MKLNWDFIFLIVCSIGAIQSFLIGIYFTTSKGGRRISNLLLGILLILVAIRVAKSTLWLFFRDIPEWVLNLGFAAHLSIFPLLLLYIMSFESAFRFKWYYLLHFIPSVITLILVNSITTINFWYIGGYSALLYHSLTYAVWSFYWLYLKSKGLPSKMSIWIQSLSWSLTLLGGAYFLNYEMGLTSYITGPLIYGAVIYFITFFLLKNYTIFETKVKPKYSNIQLNKEDAERYIEKLKMLIEQESSFLDPEFNLTQLSEQTKIPKHILSKLFNVHLGISFTDFTNQYRIDKATELMNNAAYENHKIATIAYDSGFHTLSAFNSAFKKITGITPSQYKKNLAVSSKV